MTDPKQVTGNEGYQPGPLNKGYQPVESVPFNRPEPGAGYQPTSQGDNPTNPPAPPPTGR